MRACSISRTLHTQPPPGERSQRNRLSLHSINKNIFIYAPGAPPLSTHFTDRHLSTPASHRSPPSTCCLPRILNLIAARRVLWTHNCCPVVFTVHGVVWRGGPTLEIHVHSESVLTASRKRAPGVGAGRWCLRMSWKSRSRPIGHLQPSLCCFSHLVAGSLLGLHRTT